MRPEGNRPKGNQSVPDEGKKDGDEDKDVQQPLCVHMHFVDLLCNFLLTPITRLTTRLMPRPTMRPTVSLMHASGQIKVHGLLLYRSCYWWADFSPLSTYSLLCLIVSPLHVLLLLMKLSPCLSTSGKTPFTNQFIICLVGCNLPLRKIVVP